MAGEGERQWSYKERRRGGFIIRGKKSKAKEKFIIYKIC
jgi:hypothetical protein